MSGNDDHVPPLRCRALSLLGEGSLVLPLQGHPARVDRANAETQAEFQKYAKLPLVPLVVTPDGRGRCRTRRRSSSTSRSEFPSRRSTPATRWPPSSRRCSRSSATSGATSGCSTTAGRATSTRSRRAARIAEAMAPRAERGAVRGVARAIRERMVGRVWFVGSSARPRRRSRSRSARRSRCSTRTSRRGRTCSARRPAFADFGLWGQIYNAWTDPTPGAWIEGRAPNVLTWVQRML